MTTMTAIRHRSESSGVPDFARRYKWTLTYIAVMTTIVVILLLKGY